MERINKIDTLNRVKLTANILFSGIGCQERGFENSGLFDLEVLNTSDINKDAVVSYAAVHCGLTKEMIENYSDYPSREKMAAYLKVINLGYEPEKNKSYDWDKLARRKSNDIEKYWLACKLSNNLGDISKIEKLPYADLWTCSFPCTDISLAGKMKGLSPSDSTRSSLLWENIRLLKMAKDDGTLPKYIMFENVKNLVGKKFINDFNNLLSVLDELGFNSYWKVLNAKNCGVPQNRERVFVISIRKDIDNGAFVFPKPFDTGIRLKDILDENVDEKYYFSEKIIKGFQKHNENHKSKGTGFIWKPKTDEDIANTLRANSALCPTDNSIKELGQLYGTKKEPNPQAGRVYNKDFISPTIDSCSGGNRMPKICMPINASEDGTARTIKAQYSKTSKANFEYQGTYGATGVAVDYGANIYRIRKLTPNECWKLMGLTEIDCAKAIAIGVSDSQLYKQAENGIVTNCCELLAEHLYKAQYDNTYTCTDEFRVANSCADKKERNV